MLRPLTIGSWQKARGRGCNAGEVCARRLFFCCCWKSTGGVHATQCVCEMTIERYLTFKKLGFLEQQTTVSSFFLKYSFRRAMLQLEFRESKSKPEESHFEQSPEVRVVYYGRWRCTDTYHSRNSAFLPFNCGLFFLLKYSMRGAMLQLEFRWSKPDEKHPKQSETETRKTAFRSSKTLKSYAGDGPAAAGCPVSNPDNNCANGLLHKKIQRKSWSNVPLKLLACIGFLYKVVHKIGRLWKFNCSREIEFNFFTAWTISMKFGTLVQHAPGYKIIPQIFYLLPRDLVMVFQSRKNGVKSSLNFERS